jgi:hypothetical protein
MQLNAAQRRKRQRRPAVPRRGLDEPLDELAAAPVGVQAQDEEVPEAPAVAIQAPRSA